MTLDELNNRLEGRQALIVHFSHHAAMRGDLVFPNDLLQVLADEQNWALSCSVVTPGHQMSLVGSIGVVLQPQSVGDVLRVYNGDAGAWSGEGADNSDGEPLSERSFDASLDEVAAGGYNEWRVRGAKPIGLFVDDPDHIEVRLKVQVDGLDGPIEVIGPCEIALNEVRTVFFDWPIWTMTKNGPVLLHNATS